MRQITMTMAAIAASVAMGASRAEAAQPAYATTDTTPMWWGSAGDHADLVLYYDSAAAKPLTIIGFYALTVGGAPTTQGIIACGNATSGGQVLQPGGYCFLRVLRSSGSIVGRIVATDGSSSTANVIEFMHGSLEIRDANDNTLQRSDAR